MILKGFRFGMLLQFAIGPVCLFIFKTAALNGVYTGEMAVLGVTLVDGIFIIAAILGIASIIDRNNIKVYLKIFGLGAVLSTIFFLSLINLIGSFTRRFLPNKIIRLLNISVGILLIYFGIRMVLKSFFKQQTKY